MITKEMFMTKHIKNFYKYIKPSEGCWKWTGASDKKGYGKITINLNGKRCTFLAHRFSYILKNGSLENSLCVLHKCDNPSCVNPDHLDKGTIRDNNLDMFSKGRNTRNVIKRRDSLGRIMPIVDLDNHVEELGKISDSELAKKLGTTQNAVFSKRKKLGIPCFKKDKVLKKQKSETRCIELRKDKMYYVSIRRVYYGRYSTLDEAKKVRDNIFDTLYKKEFS